MQQFTVIVTFRLGDNTGWSDLKVNANTEQEALKKASLPPRFKIFTKQIDK